MLSKRCVTAASEILDLAIEDVTARKSERAAATPKAAERRGIFLISEAFAVLRALVGIKL